MSFEENQAAAWIEISKWAHEPQAPIMGMQDGGSAGGPGSSLAYTKDLRGWLGDLLVRRTIMTMLDAPCGDWRWMELVDLGTTIYTGWDVVPEILLDCEERACDRDIKQVTFDEVNLLTTPWVERYDLILCRDFLAHLPDNQTVASVLFKFLLGGSTYLLASNYPEADNGGEFDREGGQAWPGYFEPPVNLTAPPFNLGPPLESCPEPDGPFGVLSQKHELALFRLDKAATDE